MASRAFTRVEPFHGNWQRISAVPNRIAEASECNPPAFTQEKDGLYVSSRVALGGAKAAMIAISLEAAVVVFPFAIWQFCRLFR